MNWIIASLIIILFVIIGYLIWYIRKLFTYRDPLPQSYHYRLEERSVWGRLACADRAYPIWHSKLRKQFRVADWDQGIFFFYGSQDQGPSEADVILVYKNNAVIAFAVTHKTWHGNVWKIYTVCLGYLRVPKIGVRNGKK